MIKKVSNKKHAVSHHESTEILAFAATSIVVAVVLFVFVYIV